MYVFQWIRIRSCSFINRDYWTVIRLCVDSPVITPGPLQLLQTLASFIADMGDLPRDNGPGRLVLTYFSTWLTWFHPHTPTPRLMLHTPGSCINLPSAHLHSEFSAKYFVSYKIYTNNRNYIYYRPLRKVDVSILDRNYNDYQLMNSK